MVAGIRAHHLPAFVSYTAGTFVCNSIMYHALYLCERRFPGTIAGFMHVPYEPGQVVDKPEGTPSMPLDTIAASLEYAIEAVVARRRGGRHGGRRHALTCTDPCRNAQDIQRVPVMESNNP